MIVRFATPEDEPFLAEFINFGEIEVEWEGAHESWLIAVEDDKLLGAIQAVPSRPLAHLEFLTVAENLPTRKRFEITLALTEGASQWLKANGTPVARIVVEFENKAMKKLLKKYYNGRVVNQGNLMLVESL